MSSEQIENGSQDIQGIKNRIAAVQQKPLEEHPGEFEAIHDALSSSLTEIDGL